MSRIDAIKARYDLIRQEQLDGVLESFRFRDGDLAARGGGLLGFAGLMMASDLVFIYANSQPSEPWAGIGLAAAFVLAVGAWLAYRSLTMAADYSRDATARAFLERWERQLRRRRSAQRISAGLTALGTCMFLCAMLAHRLCQRLPCSLPF
jgi:hypothetical protein